MRKQAGNHNNLAPTLKKRTFTLWPQSIRSFHHMCVHTSFATSQISSLLSVRLCTTACSEHPPSPSPRTPPLCPPAPRPCRTRRAARPAARSRLSSRRCPRLCRLRRRCSRLRSRLLRRLRTVKAIVSTGQGRFEGGGREKTCLCGAFDVLGVAADEGGLLLVGGHGVCGFCGVGMVVVVVVFDVLNWLDLEVLFFGLRGECWVCRY